MSEDQRKIPPARLPCPIESVLARRNNLRDVWIVHHLNKVIEGKRFEELILQTRDAFPESIPAKVLVDSLRHLVGTTPDVKTLTDTAWRLAGNIHRLRRLRFVTPWSSQPFLEWVPVQVLRVTPQKSPRGKFGSLFKLQVLAGTSCPGFILKWWSHRTVSYLSRQFGFTRFRGHSARAVNPHPYTVPEEFTSLRFLALVDPLLCQEGPGFEKLAFPGTFKAWNSEQLRWRARQLPGYECPFSRPADLPCFKCRYGYRECWAGTHRETYQPGACSNCLRENALHDPESASKLCVDCERGRVL